MPAPSNTLLTALRAGTVSRHLFFKMTHSEGTVLAWDGIGKFALLGDTYLGINGGNIAGVSDSRDIQNHEVVVGLSGVPLEALHTTDPNIRNEDATILAAWISEDGTVVASKVLFEGYGDNLRTKIDGDSLTISAKLRGKLADWSSVPGNFYTDNDQRRTYEDDSGFQFVKELENSTVAGWSKDVEATAAAILNSNPTTYRRPIESIGGELIGHDAFGMTARGNGASNLTGDKSSDAEYFVEETSGAYVTLSGNNWQVGGVNLYLDISNDVRTAGGKLVKLDKDAGSTDKLRKITTIASDGTAGADYVASVSLGAVSVLSKNGATINTTDSDRINLIFDNADGAAVQRVSGTARNAALAENYVEDVTGTAITFDGSDHMQVGGGDCLISNTGVVLSPGNRRLVLASDTSHFLRIWT